MGEEGAGAVVEVAKDMGKTALKEAARAAVALSFDMDKKNFFIKIENNWLVGLLGVSALGLMAFYIHRKYPAQPTERIAAERALENPDVGAAVDAVRNSLERNEAGHIDPEVMRIENGSILVEIVCHTEQSFLLFLDEFEAGKIKQRLEKEFRIMGCEEELKVTITNLDDVHKNLTQIR